MKNENDMNLLYKKWCSDNCLPFQSADETLHNLDVTEDQRSYLECFIHVSDIHNAIDLENFNNSAHLVNSNFEKNQAVSTMKKNFQLNINDMISQLDLDNNYTATTDHLEMKEEHQEILNKLLELLLLFDNYKTVDEYKAQKDHDRKVIKEQLSDYLNKYQNDTDIAVLIGEWIE